jgi:hypothetical protein
MKNNPTLPPFQPEPSEGEIREYAYHLYEQSGSVAGRELDNWLEATACLKANIPAHCSHRRLHGPIQNAESAEIHAPSAEATNLVS